MSNPTPDLFEKTAPKEQKTAKVKSDKLWISAALVALVISFGASDAKAEGGLLGGLGNSVSGLTSGLTDSLGGSGDGSSHSASLGLSSSNDLSVAANDKSVDASLDADLNAAAQKQGGGLGLSGLATQDTAASVNLSGVDQATSAHVTSHSAIVLQ